MQRINLRSPRDVGALLKDRRKALGLGQADLAKRVGVSRFWVNQTERGNSGAALGHVLRALAAVGVDLKAVVDEGNEITPDHPPIVAPDIDAIIDNARRKTRP
jgi:HTH-type transcriptional regulator / antitoxin HipB